MGKANGKNMKTEISCQFKEIYEGWHFSGKIKIGFGIFDIDLQLAGHILKLSLRKAHRNSAGDRLVHQLIVKKNGKEIKISDKEFQFFTSLLFPFAAICHTKLLLERIHKQFLRNAVNFVPVVFGKSLYVLNKGFSTVLITGECNFPKEISAMLNKKVFDCKIDIGQS